ncbi:MAG: homoserine dehydrogenase [Archaeoglobus sp.]|jgi:homoserine dehydrogenase|nr:MAG: homoserine dehydrogenase [Archaeoglobus sp.]
MIRIAIFGFGAVGKGVAKILMDRERMNRLIGNYSVVAVADSKGSIVSSSVNLKEALKIKEKNGRLPDGMNVIEIIEEVDFDVALELTPTNIDTGEPGLTHIKKCLKKGANVITSNKGPLVVAYKELSKLAERSGVKLLFEATVGGAMPVIKLIKRDIAGNRIRSIKGILNGTCNYILSRMEKERLSYRMILAEAKELGIVEANESYDVEGIDSAAKLVILANSLMDMDVSLKDVEIEGITEITPEAFEIALEKGYTIRLISEVSEDVLRVSPRLIPLNNPLCVHGTLNAILIKADLAGEIFVIGRGAGSLETASAVISDLAELYSC